MKLSYLQKLAITVFYERCLVDVSLHTEYIESYFYPESYFWEVIETTGLDLPKNLQLRQ